MRRTLEQEGFVPVGVEVLPLDLGLQLVLFVGQQVDFDEGVGGPGEILCGELLASQHLDGEGGVLEAVAYAELDSAQLLADGPFAVVILRSWRQLGGDKRVHVNRGEGQMLGLYYLKSIVTSMVLRRQRFIWCEISEPEGAQSLRPPLLSQLSLSPSPPHPPNCWITAAHLKDTV